MWFTSNADQIAFLPALRVVVQVIDHSAVAVLQHGPTVGVFHRLVSRKTGTAA